MLTKQPLKEWFTDAYDYHPPRRGKILKGVILKFEPQGLTVDIGLKRDGFVPQADFEELDEEIKSSLLPGQEIVARLVKTAGLEDIHVLSLAQAQQEQDWARAQAFLESNEIWTGEVTGFNRGGLLVKYGQLQAFVPASHLDIKNRHALSEPQRQETLKNRVGQELSFRFIQVDREINRLVASERLAMQEVYEQNMAHLLDELVEGDVRRGTVRHLCNFGAFVDLGGADGLIHNSELAWRRVRHPGDLLKVGDEIDVYVLKLDHQRKRISLSLKRLYPDPWLLVEETMHADQLVTGTVTSLVDFGAFVALDTIAIEGLVHISELADPSPEKPADVVSAGERLLLRVLRVDPVQRRLGLSLKQVNATDREAWLAQQTAA